MTRRLSGPIKLVCVAALVLLFAVVGYTLVLAGTAGNARMLERDTRNDALRMGLSYIAMRVRQHDVQGAVTVTGNTLLLKGEQRQTLLFQHEGQLWEAFGSAETPPHRENGTPITPCDRFVAEPAGDGYRFTLTLDGESRALTLGLRASSGGGADG